MFALDVLEPALPNLLPRVEILFNSPKVSEWVSDRALGRVLPPSIVTSIGVIRDGMIVGGVIFQDYTGRDGSVKIHVASIDKRWITPDMLWVTFDYPFNQLGVRKLIGEVPSYNHMAIKFDEKVGFKKIATIEGVFPNGDLLVYEMKREDCRWLNLKPRRLTRRSN